MNAQSATAGVEQEPSDEAWTLARQACVAAGVSVHEVRDAPGCRTVLDLLNSIWGSSQPEVLDLGFMVALAHAGNLVLRADVDGVPVGGAVGFNGPPHSPFHSHIVGVTSNAHGRGVGKAIKLYQRAWCLERGLDTMSWTYDPLVGRNAYFNLVRLGARATTYHPDFYGAMRDAINAGHGSDRMVINWDLTRPPGAPAGAVDLAAIPQVIESVGRTPAYTPEATAAATTVLLAVPRDIERLRVEDAPSAQAWRTATRAAFTDLLERGWAVTGFTRDGSYVLHRNQMREKN